MGRGKWFKRLLGLVVLVVLCLGLGLVLLLPHAYTEAEIDEALCRRLAPENSGLVTREDTPLEIVGIRRVDDTIIAAYAWGSLRPAMGYLQFVDNGRGRYRLAANRSEFLMWKNGYSGGSEVFYTRDQAGELKSYYLLLTGHESAARVEAYGRTEVDGSEQLLAEFAVGGQPTMCIWERPLAGHYTILREDGSQLWERRFTSVQNWDAEVSLDFMVDWQDCREGGSGVLAARLALLNEPGRQLGRAYIGVAAPLGISIINAQALAAARGQFGYGQALVDSASLGEWLYRAVDLPEVDELEYEAGLHSVNISSDYVRGAVLRFGKGWQLRQAGDYVEAVFDYGDYFNAARSPVEWQVMWQLDNACRLELETEMAIY